MFGREVVKMALQAVCTEKSPLCIGVSFQKSLEEYERVFE
jgi:hypothetical protein